MISPKFILFLAIGTLAMLIPLLICARWKRIPAWKAVVTAFILTVVGTAGTYLLGYLENQFLFGSRSFYGAVFLIPAVFSLVALLLRIRYGDLMDMSAPSVCMMLVLMKALCCIEGCCKGFVMFENGLGEAVRFPSQIVELCNALVLLVVLLVLARKPDLRGKLYPWFLITYGASRFVLNFFRGGLAPFVWILSAGHFWSLVAIALGGLWLLAIRRKTK